MSSSFCISNPHKICCIGAGYVGVPTMVMIASKCPFVDITVVDIDSERISAWNSGNLPIFEPGLAEMLSLCRQNLRFSTNIATAIQNADIVFVCVNTPTKRVGLGAGRACDLGPWEQAGRAIACNSFSNKIIVEKSTVPVKTADTLARVLQQTRVLPGGSFVIVSNPEFLAEGSAMHDLEFPDRVLIGGPQSRDGLYAVSILVSIYSNWVPMNQIVTTNLWSAELSKLVANAFLAQRISSINAVSLICERTGADIDEVVHAISFDSRIGAKFLTPSVGFGGSCFRKDILSLVYLCEQLGGLQPVADYWHQTLLMNEFRKSEFVEQICSKMFENIFAKKICVLGFAFKKNTSDIRESPAISVCQQLHNEGADVHVYDPQVCLLNKDDGLTFHPKPVHAVNKAHAIVVLTEWDEFKSLPYESFFSLMEKPAFIFDGRNFLNHQELKKIGFVVHSIGKQATSLQNTPLPENVADFGFPIDTHSLRHHEQNTPSLGG